jgi:hypothetical protein
LRDLISSLFAKGETQCGKPHGREGATLIAAEQEHERPFNPERLLLVSFSARASRQDYTLIVPIIRGA